MTRWGGLDGIEVWSLGPLLLSELWHCWFGHLMIWPVKPVPDMTYNVFRGTLNPAQSTLNGVMADILRYFSEFGSFRRALRKTGWRYTKLSAIEM